MMRMPDSSGLRAALVAVVTTALAGSVMLGGVVSASGAPRRAPASYPVGVVPPEARGGDISWPNCPKGMGVPGRRSEGLPLPTADAQFFIIGLTNGRAFTRNPCLTSQLSAAIARGVRASAYTMLSYPNRLERARYGWSGPFGTGTYANRISNVGYKQAAFALDTMSAAGFAAPFVWIDVEPRAERAWSTSIANNRALIAGALRAATDRGIGSGIYTYANAWRPITGSWQLPYLLWAPGHSRARTFTARAAQTRESCSRVGFTGGALVITQWVWANRDHNVTCPAIADVTEPLWVDFGAPASSPSPSVVATPSASVASNT